MMGERRARKPLPGLFERRCMWENNVMDHRGEEGDQEVGMFEKH